MIAGMVLSNLLYVVGAIVAATLVSGIVLLRHRRPKSLEAGIEMFNRELKALEPDRRGIAITGTDRAIANGASGAGGPGGSGGPGGPGGSGGPGGPGGSGGAGRPGGAGRAGRPGGGRNPAPGGPGGAGGGRNPAPGGAGGVGGTGGGRTPVPGVRTAGAMRPGGPVRPFRDGADRGGSADPAGGGESRTGRDGAGASSPERENEPG